jgi:hypothetical protein
MMAKRHLDGQVHVKQDEVERQVASEAPCRLKRSRADHLTI